MVLLYGRSKVDKCMQIEMRLVAGATEENEKWGISANG